MKEMTFFVSGTNWKKKQQKFMFGAVMF